MLGKIESSYKPIVPSIKTISHFFILADNDTYIDLDIKIYVRGKLISDSGKDVDFTHLRAVTNNFLLSLFSQCNVTLNGVPIV